MVRTDKRYNGSKISWIAGKIANQDKENGAQLNLKQAKYGPLIEELTEYILKGDEPKEARRKTEEKYTNVTDKHVRIAMEEAKKRKATPER